MNSFSSNLKKLVSPNAVNENKFEICDQTFIYLTNETRESLLIVYTNPNVKNFDESLLRKNLETLYKSIMANNTLSKLIHLIEKDVFYLISKLGLHSDSSNCLYYPSVELIQQALLLMKILIDNYSYEIFGEYNLKISKILNFTVLNILKYLNNIKKNVSNLTLTNYLSFVKTLTEFCLNKNDFIVSDWFLNLVHDEYCKNTLPSADNNSECCFPIYEILSNCLYLSNENSLIIESLLDLIKISNHNKQLRNWLLLSSFPKVIVTGILKNFNKICSNNLFAHSRNDNDIKDFIKYIDLLQNVIRLSDKEIVQHLFLSVFHNLFFDQILISLEEKDDEKKDRNDNYAVCLIITLEKFTNTGFKIFDDYFLALFNGHDRFRAYLFYSLLLTNQEENFLIFNLILDLFIKILKNNEKNKEIIKGIFTKNNYYMDKIDKIENEDILKNFRINSAELHKNENICLSVSLFEKSKLRIYSSLYENNAHKDEIRNDIKNDIENNFFYYYFDITKIFPMILSLLFIKSFENNTQINIKINEILLILTCSLNCKLVNFFTHNDIINGDKETHFELILNYLYQNYKHYKHYQSFGSEMSFTDVLDKLKNMFISAHQDDTVTLTPYLIKYFNEFQNKQIIIIQSNLDSFPQLYLEIYACNRLIDMMERNCVRITQH
ncbi:hypothetical protein PACTADRAFT_1835 [Pachysolen tannophilus NRRL Y-2460]|uniref:Uncharacterized protein n=1 Tax=Pachysolen tannophilus NRRL Y-2460 TaxID=669874 RepID=A0A1E4TZV5_PACTA|nr:hypothetical protein PACTADRAFT_1835 [Pachysolen tannophilus NRRL Y-2460]